ncbi:MAG: HAD hydrolase family protein [Gemmatimonadetes bacterium]|nr:HAD hydrolase family protein [Gemmatimonadota bacterium]
MSPIQVELPSGPTTFGHLVLDFTGTLSRGGHLIPGVGERIEGISRDLQVTVLTADTFGTVEREVESLPVVVRLIQDGEEKAGVVAGMGPDQVIAIGNGRNDIPMMAVAGVGIAILGPEGAASGLLQAADLVTRDINDALDLILDPLRLKATLRD